MAMNDADIEMLLASLQVQSNKLEKQLEKASGVFDRQTLRMERRAAKMMKNVNQQFANVKGMAIKTAAIVGIDSMVSSVTKFGGMVQDTAEQTKVSTDFLQEYGIMAQRGGSSQEALNNGIANFAKNIGLAQMGMPKAKKMFDVFDINTAGSVEDVFYRTADAVAAAATQQQRDAIVTKLMGDEARSLVAVLEQGSDALKVQADQLKQNGLVMDESGIRKIDQLGDSWEDLRRQLLVQVAAPITTGLMEGIQGLAGEIGSPEFKSNMKEFGIRLSEIAGWVAKVAPYLPTIAAVWGGALIGGKVGGAPGVIIGGAVGLGEVKARQMEVLPESAMAKIALPKAKDDLARERASLAEWKKRGWSTGFVQDAEERVRKAEQRVRELEVAANPPAQLKPFEASTDAYVKAGLVKPEKKKKRNYKFTNQNDANAAAAEARRAEAMAARVNEVIARTAADAADAESEMTAAASEANAQRLRNSTAYYASVHQQIAEELKAKIDALESERAEQVRNLSKLDMTQQQHMAAWNNIQREFEARASVARSMAATALYQATGEAELDARTQEMKDHIATLGMTQEAAERYLVTTQLEASAAALEAAGHREEAAALREKLAAWLALSQGEEEASIVSHRVATEADAIRDAFTGIAAGDPFDQIVESLKRTAIQLEIIDPLIEKLFGRRGTPMGGMLGGQAGGLLGGKTVMDSIFSLIPGFADGTKSAPGGVAMVGERGPEIVNLPRGAEVIPATPTRAMLRSTAASPRITIGGASVVVQGNADGRTASMISERLDAYHAQLARSLPALIYKAQRDHF